MSCLKQLANHLAGKGPLRLSLAALCFVLCVDIVAAAVPFGCGPSETKEVAKSGYPYSTIQSAVSAVSVSLSTTACVIIRDTQTYSEQVTVRNINTNGYLLKIMADPTFISSAPAINPPTKSTAAFQIANASVTISGINVISTNAVNYGFYSSSGSIAISSVNVGGSIVSVGIYLLSQSGVSNSTISVQNSHGIFLAGSFNTITQSSVTASGAGYVSLFLFGASTNAVTGCYISNSSSYGLSISGGTNNTISQSTITISGIGYPALKLSASSSNTVTASYISSLGGYGVSLSSNANKNTISQSTVTSNSSSYYALYFSTVSSNTVTGTFISNPSGTAAFLHTAAISNTITQSSITSGAAGSYALYFWRASSNTVSRSYVSNTAGVGAFLYDNADANTISQSTIAASAAGKTALYINGASTNTITGNLITSSLGDGAYLFFADFNTITMSSISANSPGYYALRLWGASSNTITRDYISNPSGTGAYLWDNSDLNNISRSTITSGAADFYGLYIARSSSNTVMDSYVQGSTAVFVSGSTGTIIGGSAFVGTWPNGIGFKLGNNSLNLTISTSNFSTGSLGSAIYLEAGNSGTINISSDTIIGGAYGLTIATQAAGSRLNISSITFASLSPGATAINFISGMFVSTITGAAFNSSAIAVSVNANALTTGSRITMLADSGAYGGPQRELDPFGYVGWPGHACDTRRSVGSGYWNAFVSWDTGEAPRACSPVIVSTGDIITIGSPDAVSSTASIYGKLQASRVTSSRWTMSGGDLSVYPGGWLDYGNEADPIPEGLFAHLVLSSGTYAGQYGLIVNNGGNFTVRGSTKTPYSYATGSISAALTNLNVYGSTSVVNWAVGDVIVVGPTSGYGPATAPSRVITGITPAGQTYNITWSGGVLDAARTLTSTSPIIVTNLTRNVLVRSSGTIVPACSVPHT